MKCFFTVLVLVAMVSAVEAGVREKVRTPIGTFVAESYFGGYECDDCGGWRCDSVITPSGRRVKLGPAYWPDGRLPEGIWGTDMFEGLTVAGRQVFVVLTHSVWEYIPAEDSFGRVLDFPFMVGKKFSTKLGDVYNLYPPDGDMPFRGFLYFEKAEKRWLLAEYPDSESRRSFFVEGIWVEKDGNLAVWHKTASWDGEWGFFYFNPRTYSFTFNEEEVLASTVAARDVVHESEEGEQSPCSDGCELREWQSGRGAFLLGDAVCSARVEGLDAETGNFRITGCASAKLTEAMVLLIETVDGEEINALNRGESIFRTAPSDEPQYAVVDAEVAGDWLPLVFLNSDVEVTIREVVNIFDERQN